MTDIPPPPATSSSTSRKDSVVSDEASARPPSPTISVSSTARSVKSIKSNTNPNSNSPLPHNPKRKSIRRGSNTNIKVVPPTSLIRSTSNSSTRSVNAPSSTQDGNTSKPALISNDNNEHSITSKQSPNRPRYDKDTINKKSDNATIQPDPQNPNHRRTLPYPLPPSKCPLLCVFYAEFDIVVGPKVCFQSPNKFMQFDVDVSSEDVHQALDETFQSVIPNEDEEELKDEDNEKRGQEEEEVSVAEVHDNQSKSNTLQQQDYEDYWNWSPNTNRKSRIDRESFDASSQTTLPSSGKHRRKQSGTSIDTTAQPSSSTHNRSPSFASSSKVEGDNSTIDTEFLQNSIFAATSEYIITGNELANQTITVSTHGLHILSRPMVICDTQRYERNSLLFAVGFVLRRNVDPRPFWPVLSNLSATFRSMEVESEFLSHYRTRPQVQVVLEDILVSLNSKQRHCNLLLDDANLLNLHLFRPPPPPPPPVPDYSVPILLRPEWQLQLYDWDLAINWIVPQIDGCKYVKQISNSTEVDMHMVRACLRVLRHHGVLAHVDIFRYGNIYECQNTRLFNGSSGKKTNDRKDEEAETLLDAAFWYCAKAKYVRIFRDAAASNGSGRNSPKLSGSPSSHSISRRLNTHMSSLHSLDLSVPGDESTSKRRTSITESMYGSAPRSFPSRTGHITIKEEELEDTSPGTDDVNKKDHNQVIVEDSSHMKEMNMMKRALADLYSSCNRDKSFGDMLLEKMKGKKDAEESPVNKTYMRSRSSSIERAVAQSFVDSTLTPLRETSATSITVGESSDTSQADKETKIDWNLVFHSLDHRRLVTFGVMRNIIKRVHQYPLALEVQTSNEAVRQDSNDSDGGGDEEHAFDATGFDFKEYQSSIVEEAASAAAKMTYDELSRASSYSNSPSFPASPLLQAAIAGSPHLTSTEGILLNKISQKEIHKRKQKALIDRIAQAMDGTRCDDELSCTFEQPIEKLIEMVKTSGLWNVISVYS